MKRIVIGKRAQALAVTALLAAGALSLSTATSASALLVNLKQASLADHAGDCVNGATGGLIVLNQISATDAPPWITVTFSDGTSTMVPLSVVNGSAAKYNVAVPAGTLITGATANVPAGYSGQFVLSDYTCATTPPPSTTSTTSTTSTGSPSS